MLASSGRCTGDAENSEKLHESHVANTGRQTQWLGHRLDKSCLLICSSSDRKHEEEARLNKTQEEAQTMPAPEGPRGE